VETLLPASRHSAEATHRRAAEILEQIGDGVIGLDPDWRFTYLNRQAAEICGRSAAALLGVSIWEALPERLGRPFREDCLMAAEEQIVVQGREGIRWNDRIFESRIYPSSEGVSIFLQDITALERERAQAEAIIQGLPGLFYLFSAEGQFLRWNDRTLAETGYTAEEYQQRRPLDLVAEEDRAATEEAITQAFTSGDAIIEGRLLTKEGGHAWRLFSGRKITYNERPCLVGLGIDISARKRVEEALRDASVRLELSVQASGIGLWDWELGTSTVSYSPEWKAMLGYEPDEITSNQSEWRTRLHPDDATRVTVLLASYIRDPVGYYQAEYRLRHRDGSYRWIQSQGRLYYDAEGRPWRMMGCIIDVTERRGMEEQLRALAAHLQSARDEEGERISRELHDELGAKLTAMKLDISWLDRHAGRLIPAPEAEPIRQRLRTITETIDSTVQSVRKVCRDLRPGVLDQLGLVAAIEWQAAEFQTRTGIACQLDLPEALEVEPAQATAIFRIVQELLTNVARHARATEVRIEIQRTERDLLLEVMDNGCGLPSDALARNDRYGLMGVRERVFAAGGVVDFQSAPEAGTRVEVQIPLP
jgi:two-component system sensor histidine kinase UhpB